MSADQNDILVEIPIENLQELADIYKRFKNENPIPYSFLKTAIKSKKAGMDDFVKVFSPNNTFREDGSMVGIFYSSSKIYVHTLNKNGKTLLEALSKTKRLPYPDKSEHATTWFYAVQMDLCENIKDFITKEKKLNIITGVSEPAVVYGFKRDEVATLQMMEIPEDVYIKNLGLSDVEIIVNHNLYKENETELATTTRNEMKLNQGIGIYLKSNDKLVAWTYFSNLGQLAALYTIEEYRRKGYGTLLLQHGAKQVAETEDYQCWATVRQSNSASRKLFEKAGFKNIGAVDFFAVDK